MAAGCLAFAIFGFDAYSRGGLAASSLYGLVVLTAAGGRATRPRGTIAGWAAFCAALAIGAYAGFGRNAGAPLAGAHLVIGLVVLLATTWLVLRAQQMDTAVQASEDRYQTVFHQLAVAIIEHDFTPVADEVARLRAGGVDDMRAYVAAHPEFVAAMRRRVRITDANATALSLMGVADRSRFASCLDEFICDDTHDSFADCIVAIDERRALFENETIVKDCGGRARNVLVAFSLGEQAALDRVPGILLDISHRQELEAQVLRTREELAGAQRTSALSAMSATIAHEINQPISAIQSYADAARRWLAHDPPELNEATASLAGLTQAVDHARTVMQRVRTLVGSAKVDCERMELRTLLATTVALIQRDLARTGTRATLAGATAGLLVEGDRILLKQVFVNLLANAMQAMEHLPESERQITIGVQEDAGQAIVSIADRGTGWQDGAHERAMESFYTTKPDGMGLGLAIAHATVEKHGGELRLMNGENGGAVVEVRLPLVSRASRSERERLAHVRVEQVAV